MHICYVLLFFFPVWGGEHQEGRVIEWEPSLYEGTCHTLTWPMYAEQRFSLKEMQMPNIKCHAGF